MDNYKGKYVSIIDLGTGSIRNSIFDLQGNLIELTRADNPIIFPKTGWAEQDPAKWWDILKDSFHKLSKKTRDKIIAVSVTSQREGIVPVNSKFEPLSNLIIWLDGRTEEEAGLIEKKLGREKIYDICGLIPHPVWSLSKILWFKKNMPDVYNQASKFLQAEDYFLSRMTQKAVTEYSIASRTCMLDVKSKCWSEEILESFEIESDKLPELMEPGMLIGNIHPEIAADFMLSNDVCIYTGAGDQQAAAVGTGAVFEGSVSIGIGTSSALSFTIAKPIPDKFRNIILNCAALPGMWEYEPPIWNTGGLVKWYFDQIEMDASKYAEILEKTKSIASGSDGVIALPYFSGSGSPRWNPSLKGVFYGLTLNHSKTHMLKALMECIGFEIKLNIDAVKKSGIEISNIILSGGASQNLVLCQIIADVLQMPLEVSSEKEASSKGCFILVKAAIEDNHNYEEIFQSLAPEKETLYPKPENDEIYKDAYQKYVKLGNLFDQNNF